MGEEQRHDDTDAELIRRFQSGEQQAFNLLALRHRRAVFLTVVALVGDADEAEDLTQETFIKAYQSLGGFRGESGFYTWLYRISVNLSLNRLRQRKVRSFFGLEGAAAALPSTHTADEPAELNELGAHLRAAILKLPDKQRTVFILRHFRELPHAEIAEIMDRDVGTIKANYFQAVRKLRAWLGPYIRGDE
jgi:RNA polymerase sigma factor (sigma-70 family)